MTESVVNGLVTVNIHHNDRQAYAIAFDAFDLMIENRRQVATVGYCVNWSVVA